MTDDPRPPLPNWIMAAYAILCTHITEQNPGESEVLTLDREQAFDVLLSTDELTLEPADITHALSRLVDRGYLYEVNKDLRVTSLSEES